MKAWGSKDSSLFTKEISDPFDNIWNSKLFNEYGRLYDFCCCALCKLKSFVFAWASGKEKPTSCEYTAKLQLEQRWNVSRRNDKHGYSRRVSDVLWEEERGNLGPFRANNGPIWEDWRLWECGGQVEDTKAGHNYDTGGLLCCVTMWCHLCWFCLIAEHLKQQIGFPSLLIYYVSIKNCKHA